MPAFTSMLFPLTPRLVFDAKDGFQNGKVCAKQGDEVGLQGIGCFGKGEVSHEQNTLVNWLL